MSFFKKWFESEEEEKERLELERRMRKRAEEAADAAGLEFPVLMDYSGPAIAAEEAKRAAARAAAREAERAAEAMTAAEANARRRLSERIERWKTRTLENVGDDIKTEFSLIKTKAGELEKKAFALEKEYNAVVDAHEKLFANRYRYTDEKGLPSYFYKYPTYQLWLAKPSSEILIELFDAAAIEYKKNGDEIKTKTMEKRRSNYYWARRFGEYDEQPLPPTVVLCPEPLVGGKKSKSKYSRKTKSKYSRKSKSKHSRKMKSKLKYSRKY